MVPGPDSEDPKPPKAPGRQDPRTTTPANEPQAPQPATFPTLSPTPLERPAPGGGVPRVEPIAPRIPALSPTRAERPAPGRPPAARPTVVPPLVPPVASLGTPIPARADTRGGLTESELQDLGQRCAALHALDYFQILKVDPGAVAAEIKRAFYRESRTFHPDRFFHLSDALLKDRVHELYKRVTEAYFVLRDEVKRRKYLADVTGPERSVKLRFTETSEQETKAAVKKEQAEQIGTHPKGRQFFQTGQGDLDAQRWSSAERNFKMALTYEPQNPLYKERLEEAHRQVHEEFRRQGRPFKIE